MCGSVAPSTTREKAYVFGVCWVVGLLLFFSPSSLFLLFLSFDFALQVMMGRDHTIFAVKTGIVKFMETSQRKYIHVINVGELVRDSLFGQRVFPMVDVANAKATTEAVQKL